jgi:hypothetical protein
MTRADNTHHLTAAAAERHREALRRATTAVEQLTAAGEAVTFSAVVATAGVSRSWLYSQDDLRATITGLRPSTGRPAAAAAAKHRASVASLRQRLDATRTEVVQLRAENGQLRDQVARCLGEQRARR